MVKIRHLDYSSLIVEITKDEFCIVTGQCFGDRYGNGGLAYNEDLISKEFDLRLIKENIWKLKVAFEVKNKISEKLREQADAIDKILWPIDPIKLEDK